MKVTGSILTKNKKKIVVWISVFWLFDRIEIHTIFFFKIVQCYRSSEILSITITKIYQYVISIFLYEFYHIRCIFFFSQESTNNKYYNANKCFSSKNVFLIVKIQTIIILKNIIFKKKKKEFVHSLLHYTILFWLDIISLVIIPLMIFFFPLFKDQKDPLV